MKRIIRHDSSDSTQKIWQLVDKAADRAPEKVVERIKATAPKNGKSTGEAVSR